MACAASPEAEENLQRFGTSHHAPCRIAPRQPRWSIREPTAHHSCFVHVIAASCSAKQVPAWDENTIELQRPPLAVRRIYVFLRWGQVGDFHVPPVPIQFCAGAEGNITC